MSAGDRDKAAFEATMAHVAQTAMDSALDATVVPDEVASWTSFRGTGPLPSISVRDARAESSPHITEGHAELELISLLGEGGMGQVYRATQRSLGREVAVKTLRGSASPRAVASLHDEAVVTGRLSHPNVIPVHALGNADDGRPMLVMKRVVGVGWNVLLRASDHAFWARNEVAAEDRLHFHVEVLRKVTHAIAFAHSQGILHRDIKPDNVMIGDFGEVYLVDWGIAAKIGTNTEGNLAGTPQYMAPEMIGGTVDVRTDVYLLGATLCEILTGSPPHRGTSLKEVLEIAFAAATPAFPAGLPEELTALCASALARDPALRPQTAQAFGDALDDYVRHRGSRALARTGNERVAQLRQILDSVPPPERDLGTLRRLVAESRFAFQEARRGWADNPAVEVGLRGALELAVRVEIDREDPEAARATLSELDAPPPALVQAVEALEAKQAKDAAERARLEKLAHDLDPEVEGGARIAGAVVTFGMIVAIAIYARSVKVLTPKHVFVIACIMNVGLGVLLLALWRRIKRTAFNRRLSAWVAVGSMAMVLHRGIAMAQGNQTADSILTTDLVLLGAFWAFGAIFVFRWMLPVGIGLAACAVPLVAYPEATLPAFTGANIAAIMVFILGWKLRGRRAAAIDNEP
jgi:eukaryotic-like serine/threonine-protein kinase